MKTIASNIFTCRINPDFLYMPAEGPRQSGDILLREDKGATLGQVNPAGCRCLWTLFFEEQPGAAACTPCQTTVRLPRLKRGQFWRFLATKFLSYITWKLSALQRQRNRIFL